MVRTLMALLLAAEAAEGELDLEEVRRAAETEAEEEIVEKEREEATFKSAGQQRVRADADDEAQLCDMRQNLPAQKVRLAAKGLLEKGLPERAAEMQLGRLEGSAPGVLRRRRGSPMGRRQTEHTGRLAEEAP